MPGAGEPGEQLRDGGPRDPGAPRELGARDALGSDRAQCRELGQRQRWVMRAEQPLDPAADERRDGDQGIGGVADRRGRRGAGIS